MKWRSRIFFEAEREWASLELESEADVAMEFEGPTLVLECSMWVQHHALLPLSASTDTMDQRSHNQAQPATYPMLKYSLGSVGGTVGGKGWLIPGGAGAGAGASCTCHEATTDWRIVSCSAIVQQVHCTVLSSRVQFRQ